MSDIYAPHHPAESHCTVLSVVPYMASPGKDQHATFGTQLLLNAIIFACCNMEKSQRIIKSSHHVSETMCRLL